MANNAELQLAADIAKFYDDPLGFVRYVFPWGKPGLLEKHTGPDKWQEDFLRRLGEEVRARKFNGISPVAPIRMLVSSGHGVGKSVLAAWLVLWIMCTRPRCRGRCECFNVVTAQHANMGSHSAMDEAFTVRIVVYCDF
jgi:hypothetical protein